VALQACLSIGGVTLRSGDGRAYSLGPLVDGEHRFDGVVDMPRVEEPAEPGVECRKNSGFCNGQFSPGGHTVHQHAWATPVAAG
jgi:hypothetical protein